MSRYSQRESAVGPARVAITPAVCLSQIIAAVSRASPPLAYPNCPLKPYAGPSPSPPPSLPLGRHVNKSIYDYRTQYTVGVPMSGGRAVRGPAMT